MRRARGRLPASPAPVNISCTRGLADWLLRNNVSLAFTSYQTGRLYLVGVDDQKRVAFPRALSRPRHGPVGRPAAPRSSRRSFRSGASRTCFRWRSSGDGPDRHYVPRVAHTTGDLDVHDIGVMADGRIVFVNTLFSCLATSEPHARVSRVLEAAVHLQARRRGPLPPQRPRHEGWRPGLRDGDEPERRRQRLARPARRGRLHHRCRQQRRSSRRSCRCRIRRAGSTAASGC